MAAQGADDIAGVFNPMSDTTPQEDFGQTAEYVLGLLSRVDARAYERQLAVDPALRAEYVIWVERLTAMTDAIEPVRPPPELQGKITGTLFPPTEAGPWWRSFRLVQAVVLVAVVGMFVMWFQSFGTRPSEPEFIALIAAPDDSLIVQATYDADSGQLRLARVKGQARQGRALQLWLIAGDAAAVSIGVLFADKEMDFVTPIDFAAGGVLAISDEPLGGSPTGLPTGDVRATGPLTRL